MQCTLECVGGPFCGATLPQPAEGTAVTRDLEQFRFVLTPTTGGIRVHRGGEQQGYYTADIVRGQEVWRWVSG